jgi:hypothetical protein
VQVYTVAYKKIKNMASESRTCVARGFQGPNAGGESERTSCELNELLKQEKVEVGLN